MPSRSHDAEFTAFAAEQRGLLLGAAYLMFGEVRRAEDVVEATLAHLYGVWPPATDARLLVLHRILYTQPGRLVLPWQRGERFELVDSSAERPMLPPGIVADLADLAEDQRRVIILERYVQLPSVQLASLMGTDVAQVHNWSAEAEGRLTEQDCGRAADGHLAEQLLAALPFGAGTEPAPAIDDLAHGRLLVRRRRLRNTLAVAAVLVALIIGGSQLAPQSQPEHNEARGPVPGPPRATATCDVSSTSCRTNRLREWRTQMALVTSSYLDPERSYFSGYTSSDDRRYDSAGFWQGDGGALGFDLSRLTDGSTEVFVQIATSQKFALPCGQTTHHQCVATSFMDGNVFTLADSTQLSNGLEVQYSPKGDEVITVVARNTSKGKALDINRGDLILLVQDERLLLPTP